MSLKFCTSLNKDDPYNTCFRKNLELEIHRRDGHSLEKPACPHQEAGSFLVFPAISHGKLISWLISFACTCSLCAADGLDSDATNPAKHMWKCCSCSRRDDDMFSKNKLSGT